MQIDEKVLWGVGAVILVALIIFHRNPRDGENVPEYANPVADVGMSFTPQNVNMTQGPKYLMYNRPYAFAPPVGNVLPTITVGQGSQTVQSPQQFTNRYCETC